MKDEVFEIMECAVKHPVEGVGVTDLAGRLDSSKGTVHRRLESCVEAGWLEKNAYNRYVPSVKFSSLAESVRKGLLAHGDMIARRLTALDQVEAEGGATDARG